MMKKFFYSVIFIFLFSLINFTQTPTPTATPPTVQNNDDVVKISTNLIQIDVTVKDLKGNIVRDLKPQEIEIYENGKKQNITNLSYVSNVGEKTEVVKKEKQAISVPIPPKILKSEQVRRTIALVVDDLTLSFESTYYVRRALKKFVDEQMRDGDLVAIIRTGAGIGALQGFTSDKRMLYAAIEKVRWNPIGSGGIGAFPPLEALPPAETDEQKEQIKQQQESNKQFNNFRADVFATGTLGAINYIVQGMQELPGRKSIMLLSDGFALFTKDSNGFVESNRVMDSIRRLVDTANRAAVVINTMDARGLQYTGITAADDTGGRSSDEIQQEASNRNEKLQDTQDGLTYLARQTGGNSIINNNDLSGEIRKMLDDQSYYLVGYQPDDEIFDPKTRRFNKLVVKVTRKDVKVRYRSGFFGITDEKLAPATTQLTPAQQIRTALTSPFAVNGINLKLNTLFGNDAKLGTFVRSFLHINAKDLKFSEEADGSHVATFELLGVSFGENGVPVDQISKSYTLTLRGATYQRIMENGFVYNFLFPVKKPGAYQMRVAIRDTTTSKVGSANQFIEVPAIKKEKIALSGIILENLTEKQWKAFSANTPVSADSDELRTDPMTDTSLRTFKRGTILRYFVEIYNPKLNQAQKPELQTQVRVFRDGKLVMDNPPKAFSIEGQNAIQKITFQGALSLGAEMPPGDYVLQTVVIDTLAKQKNQLATQWIQFEIVE